MASCSDARRAFVISLKLTLTLCLRCLMGGKRGIEVTDARQVLGERPLAMPAPTLRHDKFRTHTDSR